MKIGKLQGIICVIAIVACAAGIGAAGCAPAEQEVFELTFANIEPMESIDNIINVAWAEWLERESGGRIKIKILPASMAAGAPDCYDAARTGTVDIATQGYAFVTGRYPLHEVTSLPFIFESPDARRGALAIAALHEKYPELQAEHKDVKVLAWFHVGGGQILTVDKPVHTMEDLEGLQLVQWGPYSAIAAVAMGVEPVAFTPPEVYDALAKGVADGLDCCLVGAHGMYSAEEVCNYLTMVNTSGGAHVHVMNLDTWNSLPPDLQELFVGENAWRFMSARGYKWDLVEKGLADMFIDKSLVKEVYVLPKEERARWIEAAQPAWEEWVKTAATIVGEAKARAILSDVIEFGKEYQYTETARQECEDILHDWGVPGH